MSAAETRTDGPTMAVEASAEAPACEGPALSAVLAADWLIVITPEALAGLPRAEVLERLRAFLRAAEVAR